MLCPKCGKEVDQTGTEWVQLFVERPMRWSPVCHRDCAVLVMKDLPMMRIPAKDVEVRTQMKPKMRSTAMVGRKKK